MGFKHSNVCNNKSLSLSYIKRSQFFALSVILQKYIFMQVTNVQYFIIVTYGALAKILICKLRIANTPLLFHSTAKKITDNSKYL